jgi:hypothetical protein
LRFKAACLQVYANYPENFENVLKVKYLKANKGSNFNIATALKIYENYQK